VFDLAVEVDTVHFGERHEVDGDVG
jgi:hypothetical protein